MAAFFVKMFKTCQVFSSVFFTYFHTENTVRNIPKIVQIEIFLISKKAAVVSNFSLIEMDFFSAVVDCFSTNPEF